MGKGRKGGEERVKGMSRSEEGGGKGNGGKGK